jgi:hypothetical protein
MTYRPQKTSLKGIPDQWVTLLTHIHNGMPPVHKCVFPDQYTADRACRRMVAACQRNIWMKFEIIKRRNVVYVVKLRSVQELTIEDF